MKWDTTEFVSTCPKCQQVKPEHLNPSGIIQKWVSLLGSEKILTWTLLGCLEPEGKMTQILVIVDRFTKSTHFIPVKSTYGGLCKDLH